MTKDRRKPLVRASSTSDRTALPTRCSRVASHLTRAALTFVFLASFGTLPGPPRAEAAERVKVSTTLSDGNTASTSASFAGAVIRSATATTTWFLYPGACTDRANGTWTPRTSPVADSLNTYAPGGVGPYTVQDQTSSEILWSVSDNTLCTPGTTCPVALNGTRMLWCGKYDLGWIARIGYPNFTYQILYIDTGAHGGNYNLTLTYNFSSETNYDNVFLIGGGSGATDPIGNSKSTLDAVIASGASGNARLLARWAGSITPSSSGATGGSTLGGTLEVIGNPSGPPSTVTGATFTIEAQHRALYLVFVTDCFNSSEDGYWPDGQGQQLDNVSTSDNGSIYADQAPSGGTDAFGGNVIKGTPGAPLISARAPAGNGTLGQLVAGNNLPTPDICSLQKQLSGDKIFVPGDPATFHTVPGQALALTTCTFPIPPGTASVRARWSQFMDLPSYAGYVQFTEYRYFRDGSWSSWRNTDAGNTRRVDGLQNWVSVGSELAEASGADSVQLRYAFRCVQALSADGTNCGDVLYGLLYDDLRLEAVSGLSFPTFGIYPGFLAQSTFVDGRIGGTGCTPGTTAGGECWPGVRGTDVGTPAAIHDNYNSPLGDSIVVSISSGVRRNGKGVNWHLGFDRSVNAGLTIAHTNPNYVAAFDAPRIIFRLFDPATKTWSPFDSSELDANSVAFSADDTILIDSRYRMNWPPRDKVDAAATLPGGFTLNGRADYSRITFLPRGTRLQYYFKGVDINGGTTYQFSGDSRAFEVEDLPFLPGSAVKAPDILEFDVLPGAYAPGPVGTLVAGRTNTPLLNLDGAYTAWSYGIDPVVQVFRALGVRADRYRLLQGTEQGANIGGHELLGIRQGRLANYFPNMEEYAIKDSLASWYRILVISSHRRGSYSLVEESDAKLIKQWWEAPTPGTDGGDRCVLATGDDFFSSLAATGPVPHLNENNLASQTFGVAAVTTQWNGGNVILNPLIRDSFADPAAGPGLGAPGAFTYQVDAGCPVINRFDALTKVGAAQNAALYPTFSGVSNTAAVSFATDTDPIGDHDRNKALGYGYSIQYIRQGGMNLVDTRAQVLYKFLTSCRGPRSVSDTAACWPCPTDGFKYGNWAILAGFQTGTYGPLYAIQDATRALSAVDPAPTPPPAFVDALLQNRPNPFNPETVIPYSLATTGRVTVRVYDVRGRLVRTIVDAVKPAGVHVARWNGTLENGDRSASGVYFVVITYPSGSASSKKMTIVR